MGERISLRTFASAVALASLLVFASCRARPAARPQQALSGPAKARQMMVRQQLRLRGIKDKAVLAAMGKVPREEFVPPERRPYAYEDRPLPIGSGQTISQPYIVALMTELLAIKKGDKVLEIGTGSGYQAAILAELTPDVYTIEILPELAERAAATLKRLGYSTVKVRTGDGYQGWKEHAPFDGVIVTCAPEHVPEPLGKQLKEGGRMVIPVGETAGHQTLYLLRKRHGKLESTAVIPVIFVPMVH
jgi:protein-L-isoaspartate(D-aspartate) O-methyltransferase